jgi:agmatine deiminase
MPAEWAPHERCLMAWPARADLWGDSFEAAKDDHALIARRIADHEAVVMVARPQDAAEAAARCGSAVDVVDLPIDDSWIRDSGPLFTRDGDGAVVGVDFDFNAWGRKFTPYDADAALARRLLARLGVACVHAPMVLEGGAITVDGEGTLITTEAVVCNANRNPGLSRRAAETLLREHLGAECVIWLAAGLVEDRDTDGHVDNVCQFIGPGRVLVQTVEDPSDPDHAVLADNVRRLRDARDARGRALEVIELPWLPRLPGGGPPVAAPYLNLYLADDAVVVPVCGQDTDERALALLADSLPGREMIAVPGDTLARGGGGVHCITQQQPAGEVRTGIGPSPAGDAA